MRESVPDGFALDATHQPHITTLQRYVRTAELDEVYAADREDRGRDRHRCALLPGAWRSTTPTGACPARTRGHPRRAQPAGLDFQASTARRHTPFTGTGGTAAAFVTDPGEEISQSTLDWVEAYVPGQIGRRYTAHITVGFATVEDLETIEAEPFDA